MKRSVILMVWLMVLAASLLAVVPASAAPPFGTFGGKVGGGNSGAGLLPLQGWALDDDGVGSVDVLVDGIVAGRADYGRNRPGVAVQYPGYPDSDAAGWSYFLDTTHYLNGNHRITPRVTSKTGEIVNLPTKTFQFLNVTHNLVPFGKIDFPLPQAELRGRCNLLDQTRRISVISGYALDAGVQDYDTGVGYVEMLIDRSFGPDLTGFPDGVVNTVNTGWSSRNSCVFNAARGGFVNCYGLSRPDLVGLFPALKDAPHSGFRFLMDIGQLISDGLYTEGQHVLTIRSGDHFEQVANIAEIPVIFACDEHVGNEQSAGDISQPKPGQMLSGVPLVMGWALDWEGIARVSVLVDNTPMGDAAYGYARPGITTLFLGYPNYNAPGWQFGLDTRVFANGPHEIEVIVTDLTGAQTYIGRRAVIFNNKP